MPSRQDIGALRMETGFGSRAHNGINKMDQVGLLGRGAREGHRASNVHLGEEHPAKETGWPVTTQDNPGTGYF